MSDNINDMTLELMQNVIDKLDEILSNFDKTKAPEIDENLLLIQENNIKDILKQQEILNRSLNVSKENFKAVLRETPSIVNQSHKSEYMIFGKDSPFSSKLLLALIFTLLISYPIFKYIPQYLTESSSIKEERDNYELFYNYVFFHTADKNNGTAQHLKSTLERIKAKDTVIINQIDQLSVEYSKKLKKQALKAELKKLQE